MADVAIDPVCKMEVDMAAPAATSDYEGTTYYFCAAGCKRAFDEDPQKYLSGDGDAAPASGKRWWEFWRS